MKASLPQKSFRLLSARFSSLLLLLLIHMFYYIRLYRHKHYSGRTMVAVDYLIKKGDDYGLIKQ